MLGREVQNWLFLLEALVQSFHSGYHLTLLPSEQLLASAVSFSAGLMYLRLNLQMSVASPRPMELVILVKGRHDPRSRHRISGSRKECCFGEQMGMWLHTDYGFEAQGLVGLGCEGLHSFDVGLERRP